MLIVVDIPEESFEAIKNKHFAVHDNINDLFYRIANGIPLIFDNINDLPIIIEAERSDI